MEIVLGEKYRDTVSGWEGIATARWVIGAASASRRSRYGCSYRPDLRAVALAPRACRPCRRLGDVEDAHHAQRKRRTGQSRPP